MKKLELNQIEIISGGINKAEFCKGFSAGSIVYGAGVLVNAWNPIGWGGTAAIIVVNAYCWFQ
jgi:hypothetical protein